MKTKFLLFSIFLSVFSFAQTEKNVNLSQLEVNASWQKEFAESGQLVKVVTKAEIDAMPVHSLDAILESIAGIDVRQRGVGGTQADVSLRGGSFDQVLILLNGISLTDPQTGHNLLDIPVDFSQIVRIEVLQGSAARKYGNQAFSGAINIVTDPAQKSGVNLELNLGSFNTNALKASVGVGNEKLSGLFSVSRHSSEGYKDNTDYNYVNGFGEVKATLADAGVFDLQLGYQNKSFGANSFYTLKYPNQFEHTETKFASLKWSKQINDLSLNASGSWKNHYDRFELFRDKKDAPTWYANHNYHLTDVLNATFSAAYFSDFGKFELGLASKYDHIYSTVLGTVMTETVQNSKATGIDFTKEASRLVHTLNFDYTKNVGEFNISAGGSVNQSEEFGSQWHYGADLTWFPSELWNCFASVNNASRLPTFTDLYYQSATQTANSELKPESSTNFEIGSKLKLQGISANLSVFHRRAQNSIDWVLFPGNTKWMAQNLTGINTTGLDLGASYKIDKYGLKEVKLGYMYLNIDKKAEGFDSKYALDYLNHQLNLSLSQNLFKIIQLQWQASYFDRAGTYTIGTEVKEYLPFVKLDLRTSYVYKKLNFYIDLNNITSTEYVDFGGLTMPGFTALAGVKYFID